MTATLASLDKGHEFPPASFNLSRDWVADYVAAVEDAAIASHSGLVPPMALATIAVRTLLESAGLPEGAVHVGQELAFRRAVQTGETLAARAKIVSRGERAGWVLVGLDLSITDSDDAAVMSGRATLTFPAEVGA
jgi:acyl dehydratase